jgi:hypothetical protein
MCGAALLLDDINRDCDYGESLIGDARAYALIEAAFPP